MKEFYSKLYCTSMTTYLKQEWPVGLFLTCRSVNKLLVSRTRDLVASNSTFSFSWVSLRQVIWVCAEPKFCSFSLTTSWRWDTYRGQQRCCHHCPLHHSRDWHNLYHTSWLAMLSLAASSSFRLPSCCWTRSRCSSNDSRLISNSWISFCREKKGERWHHCICLVLFHFFCWAFCSIVKIGCPHLDPSCPILICFAVMYLRVLSLVSYIIRVIHAFEVAQYIGS